MKKEYSVPALEKGMSIIEMLASTKEALGITDIHERNGLPKSSIFMILNSLEKMGYIRRTEDGKYVLTLKLHNLGMEVFAKVDIRQAAGPVMKQIASEMAFTVHLAVLDNNKAMYIDKVNGPKFVQFSTQIGQSLMLHNSGVGKALAAYLPEEQLDAALRQHGMPQSTKHTMTSPEAFKQFLQIVREKGYAIEDEEGEMGIRCIAAPILDDTGKAIGALGITALRNELPKTAFHEVGSSIRQQADAIAGMLGFTRATIS